MQPLTLALLLLTASAGPPTRPVLDQGRKVVARRYVAKQDTVTFTDQLSRLPILKLSGKTARFWLQLNRTHGQNKGPGNAVKDQPVWWLRTPQGRQLMVLRFAHGIILETEGAAPLYLTWNRATAWWASPGAQRCQLIKRGTIR